VLTGEMPGEKQQWCSSSTVDALDATHFAKTFAGQRRLSSGTHGLSSRSLGMGRYGGHFLLRPSEFERFGNH
jgi:hypothetical protein